MAIWESAAVWRMGDFEREAFFFRAGRHDLYGSLYAAVPRRRAFGVVVCPGWAVEEDFSNRVGRRLALRAAQLGGVGLFFQYPGSGDSFGDLAASTMADMREGVVAAVAEAERRAPGTHWVVAGLTIGAAAAALAAPEARPGSLLFVEPYLDATAYFAELVAGSKKWRLGDPTAMEFVYGHPLPEWVRSGADPGASPVDALEGFTGERAVVRHEDSSASEVPDGFERIVVAGSFKRGEAEYPELVRSAVEWLDEAAHRAELPAESSVSTGSARRGRPGRADDGVNEHPVYVPTSVGLIGALIAEPEEPAIADLVLLQGGAGFRAGLNAHWSRAARALAAIGVRVFRADYAGVGESHLARAKDRRQSVTPFGQVVSWFRETGNGGDLLILGSCLGARAAIQLASSRPDVAALGLAVPPLRVRKRGMNLLLDDMIGLAPRGRVLGSKIDVGTAMAISGLLPRMPVWVLTGERDGEEPLLLRQELQKRGQSIDLTVVEGLRLYPFATIPAQDAANEHVVEWARRVLGLPDGHSDVVLARA